MCSGFTATVQSICPEIGKGFFIGVWGTETLGKEDSLPVQIFGNLWFGLWADKTPAWAWWRGWWKSLEVGTGSPQPSVDQCPWCKRKKIRGTALCQKLQFLVFCFCWCLCKQSKSLQLHFLKQKETDQLYQNYASWCPEHCKSTDASYVVTDVKFSSPGENLISAYRLYKTSLPLEMIRFVS